jgi:hypothetical protein
VEFVLIKKNYRKWPLAIFKSGCLCYSTVGWINKNISTQKKSFPPARKISIAKNMSLYIKKEVNANSRLGIVWKRDANYVFRKI